MTDEATQVEELSLDDVLDKKVEGAGEKVKETPKVEAETPAQAETAKTEPPKTEAATPAAEEKDQSWHLKAVLDEREKRQAAQREAQELREQLKAEKEAKGKPTSVFEDEGKFRTEIQTELEAKIVNDKLNMSQALAEDKWGAEAVAKGIQTFKSLAQGNPELRAEFREAPLPYHAMMRIVERHEKAKQLEKLGSAGYEAELKAKIRAEVEAELKAKQEADAAKRESITPSLASRRSAGGVNASDSLIALEDVMP